MATCYYICDESTPGAVKYHMLDDKGIGDIWLVNRECPEPLFSALSAECRTWTVMETYTEDDDHGDAFRYFDREEIFHEVTVEDAIVSGGEFAGAMFISKATGTPAPALVGNPNAVTSHERLDYNHVLDKQSSADLIHKTEEDQ